MATFPRRCHFGNVGGRNAKQNLRRVPPTADAAILFSGKSLTMGPPLRQPNAERRSREHLTPAEIDRLIAAARQLGRHSHRDATMILLTYRHGLRVSELVVLRREQVDLRQGLLHVRRRKNGLPSTHPLRGPELRGLRKVLRDYPDTPYVFVSERKAPLTASTVRKLVACASTPS